MKRKLTKRLTALLLSALTVVSALPFLGWGMRVRAAEGADIASVPAVRETTPGSGTFTLTTDSRFFIAADSDPSKTDAGLFVQTVSSEFASKKIPSANVMPIVYGNKAQAKTGDIIIIPDSRNVDKAQGYRLTVDAKNITVEAKDAAGVLNGLHTVLQSMVRGGTALNACTVNDWPDVAERSVYLDCGRVYFKPETIKALIRTLSWNKMNVLYLDFSNNNATRFFLDEMKVTVAGTTYDITKAKPSNGSLSQADMDGIIAEANKYGVQIIPTFNSPGHIGGIKSVNSSFFKSAAASDYDSGTGKIALNIKDSSAYTFGQKVVKLYVDYFASKGCKSFNIAADEVTDAISGLNSTDSTFVGYVNDLNTYIKSKGMTTRMFNDGIKSENSGISKDIVVLYWTSGSPDLGGLVENGYSVVNFYWEYLYYAHGASSYWNCTPATMFAWNPASYGASSDLISYESTKQPAYYVNVANAGTVLGANFAIWTDYAFNENQSGEDVLTEKSCKYQHVSYSLTKKIYILGERTWCRNTDGVSYNTWANTLKEAPGGLTLSGSVIGGDLPTPSPITLEATMNIVEDGDVRVSAVGVTGLTASKLTESVSIDNAKSVILYDVTPKAGNDNYTGNGMVSIKIPSAWDNTPIMGVEKTSNGGYRLVAGTSNNGWFSFEVSHFSVYGLAQVNYTGTTPVSVSVGGTKEIPLDTAPSQNSYETADETVASVSVGTKTETVVKAGAQVTPLTNGTYLIKNGASNFLSIDSNGNIINVTDASVATQWTFTSTSSNRYTISSNGKYLTVSSLKLTVSTSAGDVSWRYQNGGIYYRNNGNYYLSYINSWYLATNRSNAGYPATFTTTTGETKPTLTFTGHKVGTTSVIIDNVLYYIEVNDGNIYLPVKFIDYRADGMLFDFQIGGASYPYGLVHGAGETDSSNAATSNGGTLNGSQYGAKISGTTLENTGYVPGDYYSGQWYAWGGAWSRSGLVKPNLRNGLPEYTDATITHVAKLLYAKTYNSADMANVQNFNDVIYNTFIATNATKGFKSNSTTSMSAAFTAAQTWDNIQCPYDLAYYLLNNLFREDQATVTINGKTMPINGIYVDKYKSLVLVSDGNGVYSLNAKNALKYGESTIYEEDGSSDNLYQRYDSQSNTYVDERHFYPLDGLGYDSSDYFGDTTDMTTGRNGNFAMVSEAQFVYNPNQYFTFSGDDDVYLYINGVLALDLGGAHGVCTKTVKLSDVAAKCGLTAGKVADFKFFYMERNSSASNFSIKTNIELATPAISVDKKAYNATNGID